MRSIILWALTLLVFIPDSKGQSDKAGTWISRCNEKLVDVIMEDLFTPPVASRVHAYPNVAAYEVICQKNPNALSLAGQLNGLSKMEPADAGTDLSLAAMVAFNTVARKMVYSEYMIDQFQEQEIANWLKLHADSNLLRHSLDYGKRAGEHIIAWLKKDNYDYTRTLMRYVVVDSSGSWQPTSPDYANAIEPNWPLMRSFIFDSSNRIKVKPPLPYSESKNSAFYRSAMQVYSNSMRKDSFQRFIAWFWDDNPNITRSGGHLSYFIHKVSPGGHWIRITGQTLRDLKMDEIASCQTYVLVTLALYEGFLSCWTDKYIYNKIRPETYINKLIAPKWRSYIETPPFPEYPSGHSVISGAASTILMGRIPQPYAFVDSTQNYIKMPPRRFKSFYSAAEEVSLSRFYGGIHFMEALNNGLDQGRRIGAQLLKQIKFNR